MRLHLLGAAALLPLLACSSRAPLPPVKLPLTPTPDAAFRAGPPAPLAPEDPWDLPPMTAQQLDNGLRTVVVPSPDVRTVTIVYANRHARLHPDARPRGLATLTADSLLQGFHWESGEVATSVKVGGREPFVYTSRHGTFVGLTVVAEAFEPALRVIARMIRAPELSTEGIDFARQLQGEYVHDASRNLSDFLSPIEAELAFGPGHRWAFDHRDWARDLADLTPYLVRRFHTQTYQPQASSVIVVGDVETSRATEAVHEHLGSWQNEGPVPPLPQVAPYVPDEPLMYAVYSRQERADLRVLVPLSTRQQDQAALGVLRHLLSGSWTGGLLGSLRHEQALTYSVGGGLYAYGPAGYLELQTEVDNHALDHVLDEILAQLDGAATAQYEDPALAIAKTQYLAELVPFDSRALALQLATMETDGVPAGQLEHLVDQVQALTPADLRDAARRTLSSQRAAVLVVGEFDRFPSSIFRGYDVHRFVARGMEEHQP